MYRLKTLQHIVRRYEVNFRVVAHENVYDPSGLNLRRKPDCLRDALQVFKAVSGLFGVKRGIDNPHVDCIICKRLAVVETHLVFLANTSEIYDAAGFILSFEV